MEISQVNPAFGVVQPRTEDQVKPQREVGPDQTYKGFLTLNQPGITDPTQVPGDFIVRPAFPSQRPRSPADLASMTQDYFLFTHAPWLTWGGMTVDPLLEFHIRDGESRKCVSIVPLTRKLFYGVARRAEEIMTERSIFAIPRDRMRDLLWWMSGVAVTSNGKLQWRASLQYLPLDVKQVGQLQEGDPRLIGLFGCAYPTQHLLWYCREDFGYGLGMRKVPALPPLEEKPKLIMP